MGSDMRFIHLLNHITSSISDQHFNKKNTVKKREHSINIVMSNPFRQIILHSNSSCTSIKSRLKIFSFATYDTIGIDLSASENFIYASICFLFWRARELNSR